MTTTNESPEQPEHGRVRMEIELQDPWIKNTDFPEPARAIEMSQECFANPSEEGSDSQGTTTGLKTQDKTSEHSTPQRRTGMENYGAATRQRQQQDGSYKARGLEIAAAREAR